MEHPCPCPGGARWLFQGIGDPLFPELGVPKHQDLWLLAFHHPKPQGAGGEGRSIYHLHNLLQGYLVVPWILLCQGPVAQKYRISAAGKAPDPHQTHRAPQGTMAPGVCTGEALSLRFMGPLQSHCSLEREKPPLAEATQPRVCQPCCKTRALPSHGVGTP